MLIFQKKPYFLITFCLIIICSCATTEIGRKFDPSAANKIEIGKTSETQVIGLLGEPLKKSVNADGTKKYGYAHIKSKINALPFAARGTASGEKLILTFDKNGIVTSKNTSILPGAED